DSSSPNGSFTADVFAAHLASLSHLPKWWLDLKREAWNRFIALPLPKRTDELWRFSNAAGVKLDGYEIGRVIPNTPALSAPDFARSAELVFANNRLASVSLVPADLAARGVIFTSLEDALVKHTDLVRRYFQAQAANL